MRFLYLGLLFLFLAAGMQAQSLKAYQDSARNSFNRGDYPVSLGHYQTLLVIDSMDEKALYFAGESARRMDVFPKAETYFQRLLLHPAQSFQSLYPDVPYYLGMVQKSQGKYEMAQTTFIDFSNAGFGSDSLKKRALKEVDFCEWAIDLIQNKADSLNLQHYTEVVNSTFADFAPIYQDDGLYYTTALEPDALEKSNPVMRVFRYDEGAPKGFPIAGNPDSDKIHGAHFVKGPLGKRNFMTFCQKNSTNSFQCKIVYFEKLDDQSERLVEMPAEINMPGFTTTQPTVGILNGQYTLFFVSDRPGGKGGMDIWYTTIESDGSLGAVKNLEAVNTAGDEVTPFFHPLSHAMFFSSNFRQNMGGFDVFRSTWKDGQWSEPEHTGFPINSSYDDTYFTYNSEDAQAHFTSNRPGCLCSTSNQDCYCNDIYHYPIQVTVTSFAVNRVNNHPILGAKIQLLELTDEEPSIVDEKINLSANDFSFTLQLDKQYRLVLSNGPEWSRDSIELNTFGIYKSTHFEQSLFLRPLVRLEVFTFDATTMDTLQNVQISLTATDQTDRQFVNLNSDYFTILLQDHVLYKYTGSKYYYKPDEKTFRIHDIPEPTIFKDSLLLAFDTVILYFDNDQPNPRTLDTTTALTYGQTFEGYFNSDKQKVPGYYDRKSVFIETYIQGRIPDQQKLLASTLSEFFEKEVKENYDRLNFYCSLLVKYLKEVPSRRFEIEIQGFASPLAGAIYNKNLTKRRIQSIINHFNEYDNGFLKPFLTGPNPQIRIIEIPNGEEKASPGVSPDPGNRRESVFSREASLERRVRISSITMLENGLSENKRLLQHLGAAQ